MFTSAEIPLPNGADVSPGRNAFADWDDTDSAPRVSHRVALAVIGGSSLACYGILYTIGAYASQLLAGG